MKFNIPKFVLNSETKQIEINKNESKSIGFGENNIQMNVSLNKSVNIVPNRKVISKLEYTRVDIKLPLRIKVKDVMTNNDS